MLLVDGNVPARTTCPWRQQCEIAQAGVCHHKGKEHTVPFSCATARAFELVKRKPD